MDSESLVLYFQSCKGRKEGTTHNRFEGSTLWRQKLDSHLIEEERQPDQVRWLTPWKGTQCLPPNQACIMGDFNPHALCMGLPLKTIRKHMWSTMSNSRHLILRKMQPNWIQRRVTRTEEQPYKVERTWCV